MKKEAIVLLSSGLDSLVATTLAINEGFDIKSLIFFDYGQQAVNQERKNCRLLSNFWKIELIEIELKWFSELCGKKGLLESNDAIPELNNVEEADIKTAKAIWVPNRNGLFINIAAAIAESHNYEYIITGFNLEESKTFPDNSKEFIEEANKFFSYSTLNSVKVYSPTINFTKAEIVAAGLKFNAPFEFLFSCYKNSEKMCGKCESCQRLKAAFKKNNAYNLIKDKFYD